MLKIDGIDFSHVAIVGQLDETFEVAEGEASAVKQNGEDWYDIIGTRYSHTIAILRNPEATPEEWDEFYYIISAPKDFHMVEVEHKQKTLEYEAHIFSGSRSLIRRAGGKKIWSDLTLTFRPKNPQRRVD